MPITKNISKGISLFGKLSQGFFSIIINPIFWIVTILLFFPFDIVNYIGLFFMNLGIGLANLFILLANGLVQTVWSLIISFLNMIIDFVNGLEYTINLPGSLPDITIDPFNFSNVSPPSDPIWGYIPYKTISDINLLPSDHYLIKFILEFFGII